MSILFAILLFSLLIVVHELGHFLAAKAFGVQVNEFSVFMGPALWKKQIGETLYSVRCLPFGGFCAMEGEEGDSDNPRAFSAAAWWKRLIILVAGAAMNFAAGVLLFAGAFSPAKTIVLPEVAAIEPGCVIAGEQGIQTGDVLYAIDGERIYVQSDFNMLLSIRPGDVHDLTLIRSGEKVELKNFEMQKKEFVDEDGTTSMRFGFQLRTVEATLPAKLNYIWKNTLDTTRLVRLSLQMLLHGEAELESVSGPVGIVHEMSEVAAMSDTAFIAFLNLLNFGGIIGINLAIMNLLPIPALDGGRVVGLLLTTAVEAVIGKKLNPKYEGYVHAAGMIALLLLMAVIMFKDIFTLVKG